MLHRRIIKLMAPLYFGVVSTSAPIIGPVLVNVIQPGTGLNVDASTLDTKAIAQATHTPTLTPTLTQEIR